MLLRSRFVFFDFEEPLIFFYLDYIAVMGLFILVTVQPAPAGYSRSKDEGQGG